MAVQLVPVPDIVTDLPHPLFPPVRFLVPIGIGSRTLGKPALARQLHAYGIRPCMAWLPRIFGIADIVPLLLCTLFNRDEKFRGTVTRRTVFLDKCVVSQMTVNVDLFKKGQTLACKPHGVIVELLSCLFVIEVPVSTVVLVTIGPIQRITSVKVAEVHVLVEVGIPDQNSDLACPPRDK